jgi:phage shock protein E
MRARSLLVTALVSSAALVGLAGCSSDSAAVTDIGPADLVEVVADGEAVVLDVRTPEEFAAGHVAGALNIDVSSPTFDDEIAALPDDGTYVVYCRSGNRSAQAAATMVDAGFEDVYNVDAGLSTLSSAGIPLTQ